MEPPLRALIEQAEFKESFRGYDRAQVDDALEQLASRAGKLETELTKALDRLASAESRARAEAEAEVEARIQAEVEAHMAAAEQPAPHEQENAEQVRLTIVMAQRTADAAIGEARAEAERLVAQAREEADRTVADARADSARERDEARQRLLSEITELESVRDLLRQDAEVFEHHVGRQREQLSGVIEQLRRVLDDPDGLRAAPPPPKSEFTIPGGDEPAQLPLGVAEEGSSTDPPSEPSTDPWVAEPVEPEPADGDSGDDAPSGDEPAGGGPAVAVDIEAEPLPVATPAVASSPGSPGGAFDIEAAVDHADPGVPNVGQIAPLAHQQPEEPLSSPTPEPAEPAYEEDAFLAELRKAMTDDEPLGPRETPGMRPRPEPRDPRSPDPRPRDDDDLRDRPRSRFGRRR